MNKDITYEWTLDDMFTGKAGSYILMNKINIPIIVYPKRWTQSQLEKLTKEDQACAEFETNLIKHQPNE